MTTSITPRAVVEAHSARHGLPPRYADDALQYYWPLVQQIVAVHDGPGFCVGIHGAQGTGKSTVAELIAALFRECFGMTAVVLSLDDLYLTRAERHCLAADVHPLLVTRGVPGTHDVSLGLQVIEALKTGSGEVAIPRFDKSIDDRAPTSAWSIVAAPVDVILLEGWCVGTPPQSGAMLDAPVNALEAEEDSACIWRRYVNDQLAGSYQALFSELQWLLMLAAPDFECVYRWRRQQEQDLVRKTGRPSPLLDGDALERFVQHYERLTRHSLQVLPGLADGVVWLQDDHTIHGVDLPRR